MGWDTYMAAFFAARRLPRGFAWPYSGMSVEVELGEVPCGHAWYKCCHVLGTLTVKLFLPGEVVNRCSYTSPEPGRRSDG